MTQDDTVLAIMQGAVAAARTYEDDYNTDRQLAIHATLNAAAEAISRVFGSAHQTPNDVWEEAGFDDLLEELEADDLNSVAVYVHRYLAGV